MPTQCKASGMVLKGDAVCLAGWQAGSPALPIVTRASKNNLDALKTILGVAQADSADGLVNILVAGELAEQSITGLSIGPSRLVVTKYTCGDPEHEPELRYLYDTEGEATVTPIYDAVPERYVVGTSDASGNLAIQPRHSSDETGFNKVYNLRSYGGVADWNGTHGTDNIKAFKRALAAMQVERNVGAKLFAEGKFYFSETLDLQQTVLIEGCGMNDTDVGVTSLRSEAGTLFVFPANTTGIRIHSNAPDDVSPGVGLLPMADYTGIQNLTLFCKDPIDRHSNNTGHGVHATTRFFMQNVLIKNFAGHGVLGNGGYDLTLADGNIDGSVLTYVGAYACGTDGFHFRGTDATGCTFTGCEGSWCRRYGFFDDSRLNTYVGCTAQNNAAIGLDDPIMPPVDGAQFGSNFHTEGSFGGNSSSFLGCYSEGNIDSPGREDRLNGAVTVIGGSLPGYTITHPSSSGFCFDHGVASRAPIVHFNQRGESQIQVEIGSGTAEMTALTITAQKFVSDVLVSSDYITQRIMTGLGAALDGWLAYAWNDSQYLMQMPLSARPRRIAVQFGNGFYHYSPSSERIVSQSADSDIPPSGTWDLGDIVWNDKPTPGGVLGWVCTAKGTNGTLNGGATLATTLRPGRPANELWISDTTGLMAGQFIVIEDEPEDFYEVVSEPTADPPPDAPAGVVYIKPDPVNGVLAKAVSFWPATFFAFGPIATAGQTVLDLAAGDHTVTESEAAAATIIATNNSGNVTITMPKPSDDSHAYQRTFRNNLGGTLKVRLSLGSSIPITPLKTAIVGFDTSGAFQVTQEF